MLPVCLSVFDYACLRGADEFVLQALLDSGNSSEWKIYLTCWKQLALMNLTKPHLLISKYTILQAAEHL